MCRLLWKFFEWDYHPTIPTRAFPRLAHVIPVNVIELGARLEAYLDELPSVIALRLCHRYGKGVLSNLPQEILGQVITEMQQMANAKTQPKWEENSACFQGRCRMVDHYLPYNEDFEKMWLDMTEYEDDMTPPLLDYYTEEEKINMVQERMEDGYFADDGVAFEIHDDMQDQWVKMLCLCDKGPGQTKDRTTFLPFNDILRSHFGLETIIVHEAMSDELVRFLPNTKSMDGKSYHTSCFLALPHCSSGSQQGGRTALSKHSSFLKADNHLAFHQVIDPTTLSINEEQNKRFSRALRILDLKPHWQLTELETLIKPPARDNALWEICDFQIENCPEPTKKSRKEKNENLKGYIAVKSEELGKESWPQLMVIASSDVVAPDE
ncbi:hypothetical protein P153DRAFT_395196 [Dothidotthia symphoricarpi CBS 119687]|uniref:Uncharacterized protein n=1 Tax=Dothidotthia symphoricarpi CBS 119687 TaxID=1392245 RepID=A0A6A6AI59_9PLEO|nr:uncharacterized protein P153DRAFT_395196 [Dothidotthia symphoricarpi CBS 119687]KAF2130768.1 hypothetical protein P153DRAFT_395196 [Dothidotthia symphoricarpi CBS 119687]